LYRRHLAVCNQKAAGRQWKRCHCPVWIQGTLVGKPIRKALDVTSWERAEQLKRDLEDAVKEGGSPKPDPPSINEAIDKSMADAEHRRKFRQATLKKYRVLLAHFKNFAQGCGATQLLEIDVDLARQFRTSWKDGAISSVKKLERFSAFCRFLMLS